MNSPPRLPRLALAPAVLSLAFLSSCAGTKVGARTELTSAVPLDTVLVAATVIGPLFQPTFPLADAAIFNGRTNKVADDIIAEQAAYLPEVRAALLADLRERVPAVFLTAGDIALTDRLRLLRVGEDGVQTENKNFPVALASPGDLNVVAFDNGKNTDRLFEPSPAFRSRVSAIAEDAGVSSVLVSYNRPAIVQVGPFGVSATLRLETHLFLYSARGNEVVEVYGRSRPVSISGKDPQDYSAEWITFPVLSGMMADELAKYIK